MTRPALNYSVYLVMRRYLGIGQEDHTCVEAHRSKKSATARAKELQALVKNYSYTYWVVKVPLK